MKVVITPMPLDTDNEFRDKKYLSTLMTKFPEVTFSYAASEEDQAREIRNADVYCGWPTRNVFQASKQLRWIHNPGTGIDKIGLIPELVNSDVDVTNCRGPHTTSMADHVLGMMLSLTHRLYEQWDDQKARRWDTMKYSRRQVELDGRTMGILALGGIGTAIAHRVKGFGMKVYAVDKHPDRVIGQSKEPIPTENNEIWGLDRLDEMLRIADWFVVSSPLTSESRGLIDKRRIGLLKKGSYIMAISRGGIIDETALVEALQSGHLSGAGLDVMEVEPLPQDSPLWDMKNVLLSAHASALTSEMFAGRRQIFIENLQRFLSNKPFLYVCDKKAGF